MTIASPRMIDRQQSQQSFASGSQQDLDLMIRLSSENTRGALIEFPGIILATFVPILENLQNMQQQSRLPFRHLIAPDRVTPKEKCAPKFEALPPIYARIPGFKFPLHQIPKNSDGDLALDPYASLENAAVIDELEAKTSLDRGQCQELVAALCREFAFIQGPP
jgi:hypothetical protein